MTAVTYLTRHRRPGIVILCSIVAVLSMLFVLPPAIASAADSGAQAVDECNPTASNGCVNGILQDADKKPIADVTITLSGKATAETKTAADGKWAFSVADDGDYTVTIDASVAKEHGLKASSATLSDSTRRAIPPAAARPAHPDRPARQTARKARPAHPDRRRPRNRQSKKTAPMSANASGSNCIPALSSA